MDGFYGADLTDLHLSAEACKAKEEDLSNLSFVYDLFFM